uniref:Endosome-lysosome associated apoptosis and autophagy regulator family member 2 n=1 Tax=Salmo trutta TaxID=8032 RepID=A0A674CF60_SALTR
MFLCCSQCPAGTCDGCTSRACPQCTATDYHQIEAACKGCACVILTILYVGKQFIIAIRHLRSLWYMAKMGVAIGVFTATLLFSITCYFWKKNKRLEYKYSKLVMSCAVMEGEVEDEVVYSKKTIPGNRERYETEQLNYSQSNGLVWG